MSRPILASRQYAMERRWGRGGVPLPFRWVCSNFAPKQNLTRPAFNFSAQMRVLCTDIRDRCSVFSHLDPQGMVFTATGSRTTHRHGLLARVSPLRFRDGGVFRCYQGRLFQAQRYFIDDQEQFYVVAFCMPRFQDLSFDEKLVTVFHELFHISPRFDGDLRRHNSRYQYHTHSQKGYDAHMEMLVRGYLANHPNPAVFMFLHRSFAQLWAEYGGVYALKIPRPKMIPVADYPA